MQQVARRVQTILAISEEDVADRVLYGNYAIFNKPLGSIYWKSALRLKVIKAAVDPTNVMGLAGGFKPSLDSLHSNTIYIVTVDYVCDQCEQYSTVYAQYQYD